MDTYDLVVIGAGPAGQAAAELAAHVGRGAGHRPILALVPERQAAQGRGLTAGQTHACANECDCQLPLDVHCPPPCLDPCRPTASKLLSGTVTDGKSCLSSQSVIDAGARAAKAHLSMVICHLSLANSPRGCAISPKDK